MEKVTARCKREAIESLPVVTQDVRMGRTILQCPSIRGGKPALANRARVRFDKRQIGLIGKGFGRFHGAILNHKLKVIGFIDGYREQVRIPKLEACSTHSTKERK